MKERIDMSRQGRQQDVKSAVINANKVGRTGTLEGFALGPSVGLVVRPLG